MSEFSVLAVRDLLRLTLPMVGDVVTTSEPDVPFTITDAGGEQVEVVTEFMRDFSAGDASRNSCRSYAFDLLRWWRWLLCTCQVEQHTSIAQDPPLERSRAHRWGRASGG